MPRPAQVVPATETQGKFDYGREDFASVPFPERLADYPELRYMGSKHRLLPWIHGVLRTLPFETAADPFVGSGCVAYLLKSMGKARRCFRLPELPDSAGRCDHRQQQPPAGRARP